MVARIGLVASMAGVLLMAACGPPPASGLSIHPNGRERDERDAVAGFEAIESAVLSISPLSISASPRAPA